MLVRKAIRSYGRLYDLLVELYFAKGLFAGKDQNVMATLAIMHPEVVTLVGTSNSDWFYMLEWLRYVP